MAQKTKPAKTGPDVTIATKSKPKSKVTRKVSSKVAKKTKKPAKRRSGKKVSTVEIQEIFDRFAKAMPDPKGELEYVNVYTLLVAVVLSAQATDAGVNKATRTLFKAADTPQKMVALGEDKVRDYIKTIGLYRNKAKNVIQLSRQLIEHHSGGVPEDRDALESLPGVGRKTANVVLNMYFGHPTMAVDTHVFRLANRIGLSTGKNPLEVEEDLLKILPKEYGVPAHHWLILHGRYICKARKPECQKCIIHSLCKFKDKTPGTPYV